MLDHMLRQHRRSISINNEQNEKKYFTLLAALFLLGIATVFIALFFQYTVDDAYITFRHSSNLLFNGNLSWNIRGAREEAFTNPLYVFLGIFGLIFNVKPELPIKILSLLVIFFWYYRIANICRPLNTKKILFVSFLFFCFPPLYVHAFSGLETILFAYSVFEFIASKNTNLLKDLAISSLALSCRPEGILFFAFNLISRTLPSSCLKGSPLSSKKQSKASTESAVKNFFYLVILVAVCTIYIFKFYWFADILPNTFYAKSSKTINGSLLITNLISFLPWATLLFLASTNLRVTPLIKSKLIVILIITSLYLKSSLAMNYLDRFWFQIYFPLIVYFFAVNIRILSPLTFLKVNVFRVKSYVSKICSIKIDKKIPVFGTLVLIFYSTASVLGSPSEYLHISVNFGRSIRSHYALGKSFNQILPPSSTIMAGDVGLIGFYANRLMYDLNGLGTRLIATKGITQQTISKLNPEVLVLYGHGCGLDVDYRHRVELNFANNNNLKHVACFSYAAKESSHVYISKKLLDQIDVQPLVIASKDSRINKRSSLTGIIDDLNTSYSYLFSKMSRP